MRTLAYIAIILLIVSFVEPKKKPKKCKGLDSKKYLVGKGYEENCQAFTCTAAQSKRKKPQMVKTTSTSCCKQQDSEKLSKCAQSPYQESVISVVDNSTDEIKTPSCVTIDGDMAGASCTFPFIYDGTRYMGCTSDGADDGISWCSINVDKNGFHVKGDDHWGHCGSECPTHSDNSTDDIKISYCVTASGATCEFPFIYNDTAYMGCTLDGADNGLSWCSTKVDNNGYHIKGDNNWGNCDKRCTTLTGRFIGPLNITTVGSGETNFNDRSNGAGAAVNVFFDTYYQGSWSHPRRYYFLQHGRHCWTDGSGYCPNGDCYDSDGPQGVVIDESRWVKPSCIFVGRLMTKKQTCCKRSLQPVWRQMDNANCWYNCGKKGGSCRNMCGNGFCCRRGYGGCPAGAGEASPNYHRCVIKTADYLNSPNYPEDYPNNVHATHTMQVANGRSIHVTFKDFDVEYGGSHCPYDYVKFCDLYGRCKSKMCGTNRPQDFTLGTSTATVVFKSDSSVMPRGFLLSYRAACSQSIRVVAHGTRVHFLSGTWIYYTNHGGRAVYKYGGYYMFYHANRWVVEPVIGQHYHYSLSGGYELFGYLRLERNIICPEDGGNRWKEVYTGKLDTRISVVTA